MALWARIDNFTPDPIVGTVVELTNRDPIGRYHPSMIWIDTTGTDGVLPGWTYNTVTTLFAPPVSETPPPPTRIPVIDLINRFTPAEQTGIAQAVQVNSDILLWWSKLLAVGTVDLLDPQTAQDMQVLVIGNVITDQREDEVLTP